MEDWQGCLEPQCQHALVVARKHVASRGGSVITAEDFLLALLDIVGPIAPFLKREGVDFDELVRTIQGEQPIITEVHGDGDLSSQLIYWISATREVTETSWLNWSQLLRGLVNCAERLQDKAYVAVLEVVGHWPDEPDECTPSIASGEPLVVPVTVTAQSWLELAEDVVVALSSDRNGLIWIQGERGSGKSAWLRLLLETPGLYWVQIDLRREAEVMACDHPVVPQRSGHQSRWPVLVLDNVSPPELLELMLQPNGVARELVTGWQGPILMLAPNGGYDHDEELRVTRLLGRELSVMCMPDACPMQRRAILTAHQPLIEKTFNIEISLAGIDYAVSRRSRCVVSPGGMLEWVRRAAARLELFANRGSLEAAAIAGTQDVFRRQSMVAIARNEDWSESEQGIRNLEVERAAAEVVWHERQRAGTLRKLSVEDLRQELERWVAARSGPVHYVLHCEQQHGDSLGAGSGNIYS
ncbi:hypothetical protein [Marinobacter sp.]|uniref:hypothetical protein n=1 Tax=Marinobacter sp. TaxID=50741 RepID=UPI00356649F9